MYNIVKSVFLKKKKLSQATVKESTVFSLNDSFFGKLGNSDGFGK